MLPVNLAVEGSEIVDEKESLRDDLLDSAKYP
jgi:hypothetical protein